MPHGAWWCVEGFIRQQQQRRGPPACCRNMLRPCLSQTVLSAAGGYMTWMCEVLWRAPLREVSDDRLETPEYPSQWKTRYCIDSMLEHAVMHPVRHAFQLDELLKDL